MNQKHGEAPAGWHYVMFKPLCRPLSPLLPSPPRAHALGYFLSRLRRWRMFLVRFPISDKAHVRVTDDFDGLCGGYH